MKPKQFTKLINMPKNVMHDDIEPCTPLDQIVTYDSLKVCHTKTQKLILQCPTAPVTSEKVRHFEHRADDEAVSRLSL